MNIDIKSMSSTHSENNKNIQEAIVSKNNKTNETHHVEEMSNVYIGIDRQVRHGNVTLTTVTANLSSIDNTKASLRIKEEIDKLLQSYIKNNNLNTINVTKTTVKEDKDISHKMAAPQCPMPETSDEYLVNYVPRTKLEFKNAKITPQNNKVTAWTTKNEDIYDDFEVLDFFSNYGMPSYQNYYNPYTNYRKTYRKSVLDEPSQIYGINPVLNIYQTVPYAYTTKPIRHNDEIQYTSPPTNFENYDYYNLYDDHGNYATTESIIQQYPTYKQMYTKPNYPIGNGHNQDHFATYRTQKEYRKDNRARYQPSYYQNYDIGSHRPVFTTLQQNFDIPDRMYDTENMPHILRHHNFKDTLKAPETIQNLRNTQKCGGNILNIRPTQKAKSSILRTAQISKDTSTKQETVFEKNLRQNNSQTNAEKITNDVKNNLTNISNQEISNTTDFRNTFTNITNQETTRIAPINDQVNKTTTVKEYLSKVVENVANNVEIANISTHFTQETVAHTIKDINIYIVNNFIGKDANFQGVTKHNIPYIQQQMAYIETHKKIAEDKKNRAPTNLFENVDKIAQEDDYRPRIHTPKEPSEFINHAPIVTKKREAKNLRILTTLPIYYDNIHEKKPRYYKRPLNEKVFRNNYGQDPDIQKKMHYDLKYRRPKKINVDYYHYQRHHINNKTSTAKQRLLPITSNMATTSYENILHVRQNENEIKKRLDNFAMIRRKTHFTLPAYDYKDVILNRRGGYSKISNHRDNYYGKIWNHRGEHSKMFNNRVNYNNRLNYRGGYGNVLNNRGDYSKMLKTRRINGKIWNRRNNYYRKMLKYSNILNHRGGYGKILNKTGDNSNTLNKTADYGKSLNNRGNFSKILNRRWYNTLHGNSDYIEDMQSILNPTYEQKMQILSIFKKQTEIIEKLALSFKKVGRQDNDDFDKLISEISKRQKAYKNNPTFTRFTFETTTKIRTTVLTTTKRPSTILTLFDETEIKMALKNDPFVKRILKLGNLKREKYLKDAQKNLNLNNNQITLNLISVTTGVTSVTPTLSTDK